VRDRILVEEGVLISPSLLLNLFVVVVMFSIGLRVSGGELLDVLHNRALFVRALLANCVVIPAIGFLLVRILPLIPDASVGILLLAAIPGTPFALQFTRQAKTRLAFGAAMTFVLSLVSIAMTPLAVKLMPQTAQRNQRPILLLITSIVLYIALPLCAGLWTARHAAKIAPRLVQSPEFWPPLLFFFS
jgi:bile acid:Na+ symporter, BASS family